MYLFILYLLLSNLSSVYEKKQRNSLFFAYFDYFNHKNAIKKINKPPTTIHPSIGNIAANAPRTIAQYSFLDTFCYCQFYRIIQLQLFLINIFSDTIYILHILF